MRRSALALVVAAVMASGCGGLPADFDSLPLEEKIAAYAKHFRRGGSELEQARAHISWHGYEAADLMIPYLLGERRGIPRREALVIIWDVQLRGCDLKGSKSESAVESVLRDMELSYLHFAAGEALGAIRKSEHVEPGRLDMLRGGPCEEALDAGSAQPRVPRSMPGVLSAENEVRPRAEVPCDSRLAQVGWGTSLPDAAAGSAWRARR